MRKYFKSLIIASIFTMMTCFSSQAGIVYQLENSYNINQEESLEKFWDTVTEVKEYKVEKSLGSPTEIYLYGRFKNWLGDPIGKCTFYKNGNASYYTMILAEPEKAKDSITKNAEAHELLKEYIDGITPDLDGVKKLFEKMSNINYCYDTNADSRQSAWRILKYNSGVCDGYARIFDSALKELGIESYYVYGTAPSGGAHAWNVFVIDNKVYTVDATFASTSKTRGGNIWDYFKEDGSMTLGDGRKIINIY